MKTIVRALKMLLIMTVITGILYPLLITLIAQVAVPIKANGSLVMEKDRIKGSMLIGQNFDSPIYIWSRPSATGYNPLPSGASNEGLTNKVFHDRVKRRTLSFMEANGIQDPAKVPSEMIFASGSGLDPDISPDAALMQLNRVCAARHWGLRERAEAENLIHELSENPQFLLFGDKRINVLLLNLGLDKIR